MYVTRIRARYSIHYISVCCVRYAPDGQTLASGSYDGTVRIWNAQTGAVLYALSGRSVVYAPDGQTLATTFSKDGIVRVWALTVEAQRLYNVYTGGDEAVQCLARELAALSDEELREAHERLWDAASRQPDLYEPIVQRVDRALGNRYSDAVGALDYADAMHEIKH